MSNFCNIVLLELKTCSSFLLVVKNTYTYKIFKDVLLNFQFILGIMGKHVQREWSFILTLAYHSPTHLNLFAFVIANTFPVICTSQNSVTVSIIKQWFFSLSVLKKDFWHSLSHLENRCHWKWRDNTTREDQFSEPPSVFREQMVEIALFVK